MIGSPERRGRDVTVCFATCGTVPLPIRILIQTLNCLNYNSVAQLSGTEKLKQRPRHSHSFRYVSLFGGFTLTGRRIQLRCYMRASICLLVLPLSAAVFPARVTQADIPRLLESTAWGRSLDEAALFKLVPERSGLHFVGCPNCNGGRQEDQLTWSPERPDEVSCRYCNHRYPSDRYPMRDALRARATLGEVSDALREVFGTYTPSR